ncbi:hypothetical protein RUM43_006161 [Polyplax serrata]|uniref:Uncharacterized protein n=1 Tax=Polyplax serrata TaxID=468196 RepID=A0AAN8NRI6_POLSC
MSDVVPFKKLDSLTDAGYLSCGVRKLPRVLNTRPVYVLLWCRHPFSDVVHVEANDFNNNGND